MENDVSNGIVYWLSVEEAFIEALYTLREWKHLTMSKENTLIWIKGFTKSEIESVPVLSIPSIQRYYLKEVHLIPYGKKLPSRIEPSLLWTPIQRSLKINLPKENFNFFGMDQEHKISLIASSKEISISATIVSINDLKNYVHHAPKIRMDNLKWMIINEDQALIIGTPILPINGEDFYQSNQFIIPAGWKIKIDRMTKFYGQALSADSNDLFLILANCDINKLNALDFTTLSKASVLNNLSDTQNINILLEL